MSFLSSSQANHRRMNQLTMLSSTLARLLAHLGIALFLLTGVGSVSPLLAEKPNILFIAIDDQNDWIGCMGGHPKASTPNIDRLARKGTLFANAHCQAPLCNPSRTSLMIGLRPSTTGIYGLSPWFRNVAPLADRITLPQQLHRNGYETLSCGKIYHGGAGNAEMRKKEIDVWGPAGGIGITPKEKLIGPTPMGNNRLMDWGAFPHRDEEKGDFKIADWTIDQIKSRKSNQPFFLSVGFFLPHVPCYVTPEWLAKIPDNDSVLPIINETDREDTPRFSWYLHWELPEPRLKWVRENQQWRNLVRSYLASTAFVDAQIGRILDALDASPFRENTIVVLWGDHGWHLGEKGITGKNTLWERSTKVPLIFAGPGVNAGAICREPAELLDIFPTLLDLCSVEQVVGLEGHSLLPQLRDSGAKREWPAITSHNQGNHAIRSARYRYIRYADGTEELYDHDKDPQEWNNLASQTAMESILITHRRFLPSVDVPPAPNSASRVLTYDRAKDEATWEGKIVRRTDPIPE